MRSKAQFPINLKLLLLCFFLLFLLFLVLRSNFSPTSHPISPLKTTTPNSESQDGHDQSQQLTTNCPQIPHSCNKIPLSLSQALIHYATSNITPQQTLPEISVTLRILSRKSPCNFLVFGLGRDSLMWTSLNHGGRTVFLEEDKSWISQIQSQFPQLESYHVQYDTRLTQADELLATALAAEECREVTDPRFSRCRLALKGFPKEVYEVEWDLIMVDAPTGYHEGAPGRMGAIYTAGMMGRNREEGETEVFVHDVNREVEDRFSMALLCGGYLREEEGRLRHFTIPSHRARLGRPFCPP